MLPIPKDPNYKVPEVSEAEFLNTSIPEDEMLLATGAWNDSPDEMVETPEQEIEELPIE